jgi:hypothetical protein
MTTAPAAGAGGGAAKRHFPHTVMARLGLAIPEFVGHKLVDASAKHRHDGAMFLLKRIPN